MLVVHTARILRVASKIFLIASVFILFSCSSVSHRHYVHDRDHYGLHPGKKYRGYYKIGAPYKISNSQVKNRWYYPKNNPSYVEVGMASWYGPNFHSKLTANGDIFQQRTLTAAHRTLPMPSLIKVTNVNNGRTVVLLVNDRGPFAKGRILDVSERGAEILGFRKSGHAKVKIQYLKKETDNMLEQMGIRRKEGSRAKQVLADNSIYVNPSKSFIMGHHHDGSRLFHQNRHFRLGYNIQVGVFKNLGNAEDMATIINSQIEHEVLTFPVEINNKMLYKVQVGPFNDKNIAQQVLEDIRYIGNHDAYIVKH